MAVAVVHDVALQDMGSGSSELGKALKHTALSKAQQNQHLPATETSFAVGREEFLQLVCFNKLWGVDLFLKPLQPQGTL